MIKAIDFAKRLRKKPTPEESKLWFLIKDRQLGYKFRRQTIIGCYILDFCCFEKRLVIELDGSPHRSREKKDRLRDKYLQSQGFTVLRFWNNELTDSKKLINIIKFYLNHPSSGLRPSSPARGEDKLN